VGDILLVADDVRKEALACGFTLVGLAPAAPLPAEPLREWLDAGYAAGLGAIRKRMDERLDPARVVRGAKTVLVFGIPYGRGDALVSPIARYARGRDYHYAHRDRMKAMRKRLLLLDSTIHTYACVDAGAAMEKAWGERAGLGFIGKNSLLINRRHGSYFTLSLMILNRAVDVYDEPHPRLCGDCTRCLSACPTRAFPRPGVLDARLCLAYQTVENREPVPDELRPQLAGRVFGCDVCQEVCPWNQRDLPPGDPRQDPRPMARLTPAELAALSPTEFAELATGTPLIRAGYEGIRRNACLSLGAGGNRGALPLLERLCTDASPEVAQAARWAVGRIGRG
jgi:epoxyqueuosine reductase